MSSASDIKRLLQGFFSNNMSLLAGPSDSPYILVDSDSAEELDFSEPDSDWVGYYLCKFRHHGLIV